MRINKIDIARRQLEMAMKIHMADGDLICSITLAGAAEEIFRKLVGKSGGQSTVDFMKNLYDRAGKPKKINEIINAVNKVKNSLKHADRDAHEEVEFDEVAESRVLIIDALVNYMKLDIQSAMPLMESFYPYISDEAAGEKSGSGESAPSDTNQQEG
ncbi:hypothetical protein [Pseudomonas aeruginosa]|uniref:hypothetical protein n=1 Tax=Pseudomonas aeruginosa TaxID=287 RepID=UPI0027393028|nr:hypothetical protein [Pseudomonas aeruginosa]